MKHRGSAVDYASERMADLMQAFRRVCTSEAYIRYPETFERLVSSGARRFWVSEERAVVVVRRISGGDTLSDMRPTKRRMFREIYRRYSVMRDNGDTRSLRDIVEDIVQQPAPCFYMTASSARAYIYRYLRGRRRS